MGWHDICIERRAYNYMAVLGIIHRQKCSKRLCISAAAARQPIYANEGRGNEATKCRHRIDNYRRYLVQAWQKCASNPLRGIENCLVFHFHVAKRCFTDSSLFDLHDARHLPVSEEPTTPKRHLVGKPSAISMVKQYLAFLSLPWWRRPIGEHS